MNPLKHMLHFDETFLIKVRDSSIKGFFKSVCAFNSSRELWNFLILKTFEFGFAFFLRSAGALLRETPS